MRYARNVGRRFYLPRFGALTLSVWSVRRAGRSFRPIPWAHDYKSLGNAGACPFRRRSLAVARERFGYEKSPA
jgi:hypothetical protein